MKHHFINYFTTWWHSVVTLLVFFLLFIVGITAVKNELFINIITSLILLSVLLTIASAVVQFVKRKWLKGLVMLLIVVIIFQIVGFMMVYTKS